MDLTDKRLTPKENLAQQAGDFYLASIADAGGANTTTLGLAKSAFLAALKAAYKTDSGAPMVPPEVYMEVLEQVEKYGADNDNPNGHGFHSIKGHVIAAFRSVLSDEITDVVMKFETWLDPEAIESVIHGILAIRPGYYNDPNR